MMAVKNISYAQVLVVFDVFLHFLQNRNKKVKDT